ncbi:Cyclin-dependent kinase 1-A, partial [Taenia solium]
MGVPTEESWPGVTMLRDYNLKSFPSWYENRLSLQDKIVRALDTKGFDLLTMLLHYDPLSRIFAQRALLHPYFDNLDKNSLSAVSEERVDLMAGEIPPTLAKVLEDLISIASSELVVEKEEEGSKNEEKEETLDKT